MFMASDVTTTWIFVKMANCGGTLNKLYNSNFYVSSSAKSSEIKLEIQVPIHFQSSNNSLRSSISFANLPFQIAEY